MKKLLSAILALSLFITMAMPQIAFSTEENIEGDWEYIQLEDGTVEITKYKGSDISVTIPKEINEKAVTHIGNGAFWEYNSLESITIPDGVTSIGDYAFFGCVNLASVAISNSVTSIGSGAFWHCTNLTSITIPNNVTSIGGQAFFDCVSLINIEVSSRNTSYTSDGGVLFNHSKTSLVCFPGGKTGTYVIPNGVTHIRESSFSNCGNLTSITIPNSVTSIDDFVFNDCENLTNIEVASGNTSYASDGGVLFSHDKTSLVRCPGGKTGAYVVPNGVTSIEDDAFYYCPNLTSVTIPNSVTSIGRRAFSNCDNLTSITIPNSVTSIGGQAFSSCENLTNIKVASGNTSYTSDGGVLFNHSKTSLVCCPGGKTGTYVIPNGVTNIEDEAFYHCHYLTSVVIPNGVTDIGSWAFFNCGRLTSVTIPTSMTSIGYVAFYYCYNLTSITIPNSVTSIGEDAFDDCGEGFTIYGYENSYAQEYATEYSIPFKLARTAGTETPTQEVPSKPVTGTTDSMGVTTSTPSSKNPTSTGTKATSVILKKMAAPKLKSKKTKTLTVKWKKYAKATGYQVMVAKDKAFRKGKKTAKTKTNKTTSKTFTKLTKKKLYYAKIRAYKKVGSKTIYGAYSKASKAKVK